MNLTVVTFKECWRDGNGRWFSSGGFPHQIAALVSLFEQTTVVAVEVPEQKGGSPLPAGARLIPLRRPAGEDMRRKISVLCRLPVYLVQIGRQVRNADVVYIPLPGDLSLLGLAVALALKKRIIGRYGSSWPETDQTTFMNRVTKLIMRTVAGGRRLMLAAGRGGQLPAPRMEWIFSTAISEDEVRMVRPDLDRRPRRPIRVVYAGRISGEKGLDVLLEGVRRWRKQRPELPKMLQVEIVGDGPLRPEFERNVAAADCSEIFRFAGQQDRSDLLRSLLDADVCVLPSRTEGFPKVRLDAMLCGVPVLTTDVGYAREIVGAEGERGWVVPAGDPEALAGALMEIAEQPRDWPALRRRCRFYAETFTLERWRRQIGESCVGQWGLTFRDGRLEA